MSDSLPDQSEIVDRVVREADASDDLARRYRRDAEYMACALVNGRLASGDSRLTTAEEGHDAG